MNRFRADLHLHSKFSDRAADWISRKLELPASCTEPAFLYDHLHSAGFKFITITDHNTIEGCLRIADRPGVFLSEELICSFPEDACKVHLLVWGITERQHLDLQSLRSNLYDVRAYLAGSGIAHAVAHPLHNPDERLTPRHVKILILLFRHFESITGTYPGTSARTAQHLLSRLTPELIERYAHQTGVAPAIDEPWRKAFVGGSDDHGGVFAGRAWTQTPPAKTPEEFLVHVREGRCEAGGEHGSPLTMAHGMYGNLFEFAKQKFSKRANEPGMQLLEKVASRFMEGKDPTVFTLGEKIALLAQGIATGKVFEMARAGKNSLWKELAAYFSRPSMRAAIADLTRGVRDPERRAFLMADMISSQLAYRFFEQFVRQLSTGKILESIQMIAPLVPIVGLLAPYLQSFRLTPLRRLREICADCEVELPEFLMNHKRAWFTDTLDDVNGVSTTIQKMAACGKASGRELVVVTSRPQISIPGIELKNFEPIGEFELPEYELQRLSFPPVLRMLDWIERNEFTELVISTPGPVGLSALLAAKLLGIPCSGIYHTDFPQYVGILTDDAFMETLTWNYMHWFYSQQDVVWVNSADYLRCWEQRGISPARLRILPRGLDTALFHPSRRDPDFWRRRGLREGEVGALFAGRVSKEKNLDLLVAAAREIERLDLPVRFLFVGHGPFSKELAKLLPSGIYTGYLSGEELAAAYASADFFVFPSTTDTFGNVILEAQASGLPCVVSDLGGPRDLVGPGIDGFITRSLDLGELTAAIRKLATDPSLRSRMGAAARKKVESRDWRKAFDDFWNATA